MANGDKKKKVKYVGDTKDQVKAYVKEAKKDIKGKGTSPLKSGPFQKKFMKKGGDFLYPGGKRQIHIDQDKDIEFATTKKGQKLAKLEQRVKAKQIKKLKRKGTYDPEWEHKGLTEMKYSESGVRSDVAATRAAEVAANEARKGRNKQRTERLYRTDEYGTKSEEGLGKFHLQQEASESTFKDKDFTKIKEASNR
tara:strand:+ start:545 stop:1129 length:585 start_codon:yes stop_codon:yes gene_type:complete